MRPQSLMTTWPPAWRDLQNNRTVFWGWNLIETRMAEASRFPIGEPWKRSANGDRTPDTLKLNPPVKKSGTNSTRCELPEWNQKRCGNETRFKIASEVAAAIAGQLKSQRRPAPEAPANKKRGEQYSPRHVFRLIGVRQSSATLTSSVIAVDLGGGLLN